jgi:hypothetical protein
MGKTLPSLPTRIEMTEITQPGLFMETPEIIQLAAKDEVAMPTPAPAGGLVERVRDAMLITQSIEEIARAAIREVADWLQQRTDTIANGSQWADLLREEAGR